MAEAAADTRNKIPGLIQPVIDFITGGKLSAIRGGVAGYIEGLALQDFAGEGIGGLPTGLMPTIGGLAGALKGGLIGLTIRFIGRPALTALVGAFTNAVIDTLTQMYNDACDQFFQIPGVPIPTTSGNTSGANQQ